MATVPALRGCVSQGRNRKEVIEGWLLVEQDKRGKPVRGAEVVAVAI